MAELDQRSEAGVAEVKDGAQQTGNNLLALLARAVFFEQQVTEPLFEAIDEIENGLRGQIGS